MIEKGERFVDLSMRILSGTIVIVLLAAFALLLWQSFVPAVPQAASVPLVEAPASAPAVKAVEAPPDGKAEVLLDPGRIYRCVSNGRTTFSDRPCPDSATRR